MLVLALVLGLAAAPQGPGPRQGWEATPAGATVGDTVWVTRSFSLPAGWRLRPGRLEGTGEVESLGDPAITRRGTQWIVGYPVTGWSPGTHQVLLPPLWRLGPDGQADSIAGAPATFEVHSVIPATDTAPVPRPALAPLRTETRHPLFLVLALAATGGGLAATWWWRRRRARPLRVSPRASSPSGSVDDRWLKSGEPRAVATRAAGRLRGALARLVPEAHQGLSTAACLEVIRRQRPAAALDDVQAVLESLDRQAFAREPDGDIRALARHADALAERLER